MATICKIIVPTDDEAQLVELVSSFLARKKGVAPIVETLDGAAELVDYTFHNSDQDPDYFYMSNAGIGLLELNYNSFSFCDGLASAISRTLNKEVATLIYQSTAEAGYFSLHIDGSKRRSIEFGDGEVTNTYGDLLDFEEEPIGHSIEDEELAEEYDDAVIFDSEDLYEYLKEVGFDTEIFNGTPASWTVIYSPKRKITRSQGADAGKKPWWKIW